MAEPVRLGVAMLGYAAGAAAQRANPPEHYQHPLYACPACHGEHIHNDAELLVPHWSRLGNWPCRYRGPGVHVYSPPEVP